MKTDLWGFGLAIEILTVIKNSRTNGGQVLYTEIQCRNAGSLENQDDTTFLNLLM